MESKKEVVLAPSFLSKLSVTSWKEMREREELEPVESKVKDLLTHVVLHHARYLWIGLTDDEEIKAIDFPLGFPGTELSAPKDPEDPLDLSSPTKTIQSEGKIVSLISLILEVSSDKVSPSLMKSAAKTVIAVSRGKKAPYIPKERILPPIIDIIEAKGRNPS
ncbi:hypothetical protein ACLOJK_027129 [Asimina triloba]